MGSSETGAVASSAPCPRPLTDRREAAAAEPPVARVVRIGRSAVWTVAVFSLFVNLLVLALPLYSLQVFDRVLSSRSVETLIALTAVTLWLLALQAGLDHVRGMIMRRAAARVDDALGDAVLRGCIAESARGDARSTAPMEDLRQVRGVLSSPGLSALFDLPTTPFFVLVVFLIHPGLGLFVLAAILLLALLAAAGALAGRSPQKDEARAAFAAGDSVKDYTRHAEALQAMGMVDDVLRRWRDQNGRILALNAVIHGRIGAILSTTKFARMAVQVGITGLGAWLVLGGAITPGAMIASSLLMARALAPIEQAVGSWKSWASAYAAGKRLREALGAASEAPRRLRLPAPVGNLSCTALHYLAPETGAPILRGVSLELAAGQSLAVVGPSGAGKSTLARLLAGVLAPAHGEIRIDGADASRWDRAHLGPHIGYLPQGVQLLAGTVAENISRFEPAPDEAEIVAAAKTAQVHDLILRLPDGYDTRIGEGGIKLSGGQQQRIALARALYGRPRILILDEPNSNLDPSGEEALVAALESARADGCTIVVVSHRPSLLRVVDWIMVLRDGLVERAGSRDDLMRSLGPQAAPQPAQDRVAQRG